MYCERCGHALAERTVTEHGRQLLRHACTACDYIRYGNPVPVVQCIVERDGHILMARNLDWPPNMYGLVSGFLEAREQPAAGMARELQEEVALTVQPAALRLVGVATFGRLNQLLVLYHVRVAADTEVMANEEELAGIKWVPFHRIRFRWSDGAGPLLKAWLAERAATGRSKL